MTEFVGRLTERQWIGDALGRAVQGEAQLVLCVGDPGMGKTRLAQEAARLAETMSVRVCWGRGTPDRGAPPYWPWQEVLGTLPSEAMGETDEDALLLWAADRDQSFEARMRRFDAVRLRLSRAAEQAPLLLVIDDFDAADESSRLLAQYLTRSLGSARVLLLGTCREASGTLGALAHEPNAMQIELRGLNQEEGARQVSSILGTELPEDDMRRLYLASGGNPFFLEELARQHADGSRPGETVPRSVKGAVARRLAPVSSDCRSMLEAAAVVGETFSVPVVAAVMDRTERRTLALLDEAARARLVVDTSTPGALRFTHELVRDAIIEDLSLSRRGALHRAAAVALEESHRLRPHAVVFEVARHWSRAAIDHDASRAVGWLEAAGHEAMRQHAYDDGHRWFVCALQVGQACLDDRARAELLLALARAAALSGDLPGALDSCGQVLALAADMDTPDLAGRAALVTEPTFDPQVDRVLRQLCERALTMLDSTHASLRAKVLAQQAWVCDHLGDVEAARAAVLESLALADVCGDAGAVEAALVGHHMVHSGPDGLAEREASAQRMWELGERYDSASARLLAAEWRFDASSERGDLAGAAKCLEAIAYWADRLGGPLAQWRVLRCRAMLAQARGQLDDARRYATTALATMAPSGYPPAYMLFGGFMAGYAHHAGYTPETLTSMGITEGDATLEVRPVEGVVLTLGPAAVLLEVGRLAEARTLYRRLGPATEWSETPHAQLFTWAMGIGVATQLGADADVAVLHERLAAYRGHHIVNGRYAMAYAGPAELHLGIASAHLGLLDDAVDDLEGALKACFANNAEGFRAETQHRLASILVRRSAPGDIARARTLTVDAARVAGELGMPALRHSAADLLGRIDDHPSMALTRREHEVATLVAEGMTNRDVATRLYLSERTAQNHVQHILDKLNLRNRSQIGGWLRESEMSRAPE